MSKVQAILFNNKIRRYNLIKHERNRDQEGRN